METKGRGGSRWQGGMSPQTKPKRHLCVQSGGRGREKWMTKEETQTGEGEVMEVRHQRPIQPVARGDRGAASSSVIRLCGSPSQFGS